MDRMKRFTAIAKGSSAVRVRKDEDESSVLFGELYKHDKEKDLNLLEPMYSMEFEAIQETSRDPAFSKEENSAYRIDKRSCYTPLTHRQHNAVPATTTNTADTKPTKKTSGKKPAVSGHTNAVKKVSNHTNAVKKVSNQEFAEKAHKNITTASIPSATSKEPSLCVKDLKIDNGMTRRLSCPPAATVAPKGTTRIGTVPATGKGGRAAEAAVKGGRRMGGEKEQRPKLGIHAKKLG